MKNYKDFISLIRSKGAYVFSKEEALQQLDTHEGSLKVTLARNIKSGNLVYLGQQLYMVIPPEYKGTGAPPPEWYIDDLMGAHGCHYYVGLLTAAALHGAAHQAPQIFQVICDKKIPAVRIERSHIQFYYAKSIEGTSYQKKNTPTGYINLSTPEVTAFDLVKYMRQSGHLNHVATVLAELGETLKAQRLKDASLFYPFVYSQRLGYMLDELGHTDKTATLNRFLLKHPLRYTPLRSDALGGGFPKNEKWHIIINETLEPDI